ncbi:MAG: sigma-70 family RNA polymerase sigma factor [Pirellulaceae bacterium]|nr:sigma-70 family RNA polymerase sigma factor [Pirellulaceae bacterium]
MVDNQPSELQRLIDGGDAALAELFSEYRDRLERIVTFRLDPRIRGRFDSSDVLQEAYIEIARRFSEYIDAPSVSFFVWLRQRTLQTMIDLHREHFREKRDPDRENRYLAQPTSQATSMSIARFLIDDVTSPSQAAVEAEETQRLHAALDSMQEIDREVLALRHFEHLSNLQVAEILNLSPTAASNRYIRAAARLSEIVASLHPSMVRKDVRK